MRVFQSTYKGRDGRPRRTNRWYVEFTDHREQTHRLPGLTDRRQTEALGRRIEDLVGLKVGGQTLPPDVTKWVESLPARIHRLLGKWGLLDAAKTAALRPLIEHLDGAEDLPGFQQYLAGKGNTGKHVTLVCTRVKSIIDGCCFSYWSDVSASKVLAYLDGLRANRVKADRKTGKPKLDAAGQPMTRRGISAQTFNFYLTAFKGFCRWMVKDGRASESPVVHLDGLNVKTDRRHDRRALSVDELRWLLDVTAAGPVRRGASGRDRSMVYQVATETGLRAGELRSLTRASFDLAGEPATVTVAAAYSKHRRADTLPLRTDTAAKLVEFFSTKTPDAPAFTMPPADALAGVMRKDLADARDAWIADAPTPDERAERGKSSFLRYRDGAGRVADFHSLRHSCGSLLAAAGVHPKVAQSIMRHSTIDLTMSRYSHVFAGQEADAVADLPDLSAPKRQAAQATGTDGRAVGAAQNATGRPQSGPDSRSRLSGPLRENGRQDRPQDSNDAEDVGDDGNTVGEGSRSNSGSKSADSVFPVCLAESSADYDKSSHSIAQDRVECPASKRRENHGKTAVFAGNSTSRRDGRVAEGDGLENRSPSTATTTPATTCETTPGRLSALLGVLAAQLAPFSPELARVLTAWPRLPEALRAGIMAMIHAADTNQETSREAGWQVTNP